MSPLENLASASRTESEATAGIGSGNDPGKDQGSTPRPQSDELSTIHELVESLEQVLFLISADWTRAYYVSPAFERVTGFSRDTLADDARAWTHLVHPD